MKNLFAECPILIYELNKIMPKNNKLPLLNQDNSDDFFEKLKDKDESAYKEFIKLIIQYRDENLNIEVLTTKVEELLSKYPELLEEAMLFIDHKKLNNMNFRKNIINKNNINNNIQNNNNYQNTAENNQINIKKENIKQTQNTNASNIIEKHQTNKHHFHHYMSQLPPKIQSSPDYMFLNSLKDMFSPEIYKTCPSSDSLEHTCIINVDLPIPGSPPIKLSEPSTIPPPNTLFNSSYPVSKRISFVTTISFSFLTVELFEKVALCPLAVLELFFFVTFSSTKLFQLLHPGHFPIHLADSYPHSLQKNTVLVAIYISPCTICA